jgi:hypothetical protein
MLDELFPEPNDDSVAILLTYGTARALTSRDLSRQTAFYLEEDPDLACMFLRTYLGLLPVRPGLQERFPVYMLLDRLVVWEYAQRPQHEPR